MIHGTWKTDELSSYQDQGSILCRRGACVAFAEGLGMYECLQRGRLPTHRGKGTFGLHFWKENMPWLKPRLRSIDCGEDTGVCGPYDFTGEEEVLLLKSSSGMKLPRY